MDFVDKSSLRRVNKVVLTQHMNILFDLDGTIIDPKIGLFECLKRTLEEFRAYIPVDTELKSCIGPPMRKTLGRLIKTEDTTIIESALGSYRKHYAESGIFRCELYDGITNLIVELHSRGHLIFLSTSKMHSFAVKILNHFNLRRYFTEVYGTEASASLDNKSDLVRSIILSQKLRESESVIIGDRKFDIEAGKTNGIGTVGVLWGYGSKQELVSTGADHIVAEPKDILAIL